MHSSQGTDFSRHLSKKLVAAIGISFGLLSTVVSVPAQAATAVPTKKAVEQHLAELGLPTGKVDGSWNAQTRRSFCAWRELTGRKISTKNLTNAESQALIDTPVGSWVMPKNFVIGLNVNQTCQTANWVEPNDPATPDIANSHITAVFPVSTGTRLFPTFNGMHPVYLTYDRWYESKKYKGAQMYRPMFYRNGEALHGSATDRLVRTYPDSHGCVRMLHADIDRLWAAGFGKGSQVNVYGRWRG